MFRSVNIREDEATSAECRQYPSSVKLGALGSAILVECGFLDLPGERDRRAKTLAGQSFRGVNEPNLTEERYLGLQNKCILGRRN
jgi:hypothetical protein